MLYIAPLLIAHVPKAPPVYLPRADAIQPDTALALHVEIGSGDETIYACTYVAWIDP